jgi:hemerythrin-like domain-containing protein
MTTTEPIRQEHESLRSGIEALRRAGDLVSSAEWTVAKARADRAVAFLTERVIPHARAEERFLYPFVGHVLGSLRATRTMARDHAEVGTLTHQLQRALEEDDRPMVQRLLYGLYHVLDLHLRKEDEVYGPLLAEYLTDEEVRAVMRQFHARAA